LLASLGSQRLPLQKKNRPTRKLYHLLSVALLTKNISSRKKFQEPVKAVAELKRMRSRLRRTAAPPRKRSSRLRGATAGQASQKIDPPKEGIAVANNRPMGDSFGKKCRRCGARSRRNW